VPRSLSGRVVAAGAVVALLVILALAWSSIAPAPSASPGPSGVASHRASDPPSPDPADASQASSPGPSLPPTTAPSPPMSPAPGEVTLAQLLSMLTTQPENRIGYDRALFAHWIDADGDGCDTRKEVLIGESRIAVTVGPNCSLSGGSWLSSYDDVPFTDPSGLDIDHMVPLAEAWDSGAWSWSAATRQAFANDIGVGWSLIAVSASSNRAKSDQDPADWLPPEADAWCGYLGDWLAVKVRWSLSVDSRERTALASLIEACPGTSRPVVVASVSSATPPPAASQPASCDPAYPTVCIPPPPPDLDCGEISYRQFTVLAPDPHGFDGDHDGVGCESG